MFVSIIWYILITVLGWITFPLIFRLMPAIADRGYSYSRILGLLIWGYLYWLMASLGIIKNDVGGIVLGLILLIAISILALRSSSFEAIRNWLKENYSIVLVVEAVFFVSFFLWTIVRAANPEILGTEKPMELAFINSIIRSPEFPPHDPWLSGYAISYYYFGYVITAVFAKLSSTPGSVAFNLALSQTFALVSVAAFGLVYSMLRGFRSNGAENKSSNRSQNFLLSLLGPIFLLLVSNLEGFLEVLHAKGILWRADQAGQLVSNFWVWLDMKELSQPPVEPFSWIPSRYLWWWRASRVVQDYDLSGAWREVIDEFPFFSYLLGDLHPHVLAMPFALLAIGLCLNLYLGGAKGKFRWIWFDLNLTWQTFVSAAVIIGGLAFLNTWDFPIYLVLFGLVYVTRAFISERFTASSTPHEIEADTQDHDYQSQKIKLSWLLLEFLKISFPLAITGIVLYFPFYVGFSSQAGGIFPNLIYATRGAHLWVMFGSLLVPIFVYLIYFRFRFKDRFDLRRGFLIAGALVFLLWLLSFGFGVGLANIPLLGNIFLSSIGGGTNSELISTAFTRRITNLGWVTLLILLTFTFAYLIRLIKPKVISQGESGKIINVENIASWLPEIKSYSVHDFIFILILMGGLLVLFVEFFFLRDQFGSRMNTIFKFYYQTWIFWGIAAAFGIAVLLKSLRGIWNALFSIGFVMLLIASLAYPLLSLWNKTNGFDPPNGYTLDGTAYLEHSNPDEMEAIRWLTLQPDGVVVEAVGPQYSEFARVATNTGQPNVLGWAGHESQWRGGRKEIGTREEDVEMIYSSNDWEHTKLLLEMYKVRYIFIGPLERRTYRVNEAKFERFLGEPLFMNDQVLIFEKP